MEDGSSTLKSKIRVHDQHHLEIKLDFALDDVSKAYYAVETYFFIPRSLNIGPHNYHKEQFYENCQRYIRFSTPKISFSRLCDKTLEYSPLNRIHKILKAIQAGDSSSETNDKICDEIKLLGCIIRGEVRDNTNLFTDNLSSGSQSVAPMLLIDLIEAFLRDLELFRKKFAELRTELFSPVVPVKIRETFAFCDEYVSFSLDEHLSAFASVLQRSEHHEVFNAQHKKIVNIIREENEYRRECAYSSAFEAGSANELMIFRRGILKKFISGVLFIHTEFSEWEALTQIIFGFAAGVAMLFASVISVYYQNKYTTTSVPFVTALVISYIFKDRIKDWIKFSFSKKLAHWISDRKIDVVDPTTYESIGVLKEGFTFLKHGIPAEVERLRNADYLTSVDSEGRPERIFKYKKHILLHPHRIMRSHDRRKGINDIMRFNIARLLQQADDPTVVYNYLDSKTGKIERCTCSRVYHINVIARYTYTNLDGDEKEYFERRRLVVNKNGIVRMEEVR